MLLTILGLSLFEIISSIDNAIINAEVLSKMSKKARKWFLLWGLIISVFLVRGMLPWLIVWLSIPGLGPLDALISTFSSDPAIGEAIHKAAPNLLMGGGIFLIFIFFHWLFIEKKNTTFKFEDFFMNNSVWFYAISSLILAGIVYYSLKQDPMLALGAVIGSSAFFITDGFKQNAEIKEAGLKNAAISDISKILYLEIIDATFSVDGVLGAFAFTLAIPLILIGNGVGAFVVREFTIRSIDSIKKYRFLKNGAMYSLLFLGLFMILEGFKVELPQWISPVSTFFIVGFYFYKSKKAIKYSSN